MNRMPRQRIHPNGAARSAAYRRRVAAERKRDATNHGDDLDDFMEKLNFVRDTAGSISRDNLAHWKSWRGSSELHCHALQDDLDQVIEMLDALIRGDDAAFSGSEWQAWRQERERQLAVVS